MPSVQGVVKSNGGKIFGTFHINGVPRYLAVEVNPRSRQQFECNSATLTYDSAAQLLGGCKWSGTVGKDDLKMNFGGGLNIAGQVTVPLRLTAETNGTGTWDTPKSTVSSIPTNPSLRHNETQDRAKEERERFLIQSEVPIIAIFGQSGTGKSSFINLIASERQKIGEGLQSCTTAVSVIEASIAGQPIVIIDTPGIDDTRDGAKEADVLKSIADRLNYMRQLGVHVTGVLFLHRISENRFSHTAQRISNMLKSLCGDGAMNQLMLCTTMWDRVPEDEGYKRFDELCETGAWKQMILGGASTATISNTCPNAKAEAEEIVTRLIKNAQPVQLAIQDEMANQKLGVGETKAGRILDEGQDKQAESDRSVTELYEKLRKEREARRQQAIHAQKLEVDRLKDLKRKNQQDPRAPKLEAGDRKQRDNEQERKARAKQLRQDLKNAERRLKELRNPSRRFWNWLF